MLEVPIFVTFQVLKISCNIFLHRTEAVEQQGMLRTKAMREREEQREKRKYRYTLIRIRFPDGLVLQVSNIKILKEL